MRDVTLEQIKKTCKDLKESYGRETAIDIINLLLTNLVRADKLDFDEANKIFDIIIQGNRW